jgi:hypothetical protein
MAPLATVGAWMHDVVAVPVEVMKLLAHGALEGEDEDHDPF